MITNLAVVGIRSRVGFAIGAEIKVWARWMCTLVSDASDGNVAAIAVNAIMSSLMTLIGDGTAPDEVLRLVDSGQCVTRVMLVTRR